VWAVRRVEIVWGTVMAVEGYRFVRWVATRVYNSIGDSMCQLSIGLNAALHSF
jgi:hypothetical protein